MSAEDLAGRIVVRHKEPGYLRFDLPAELCGPAAAKAIDRGLRGLVGVYRVSLDVSGRKLAIRYEAHTCTVRDVAHRLKALLNELPREEAAAPEPVTTEGLEATARRIQDAARGFAARTQAMLASLQEPGAPQGTLQAKLQPVLASALTEKAVTNFLNDIVAFYLIKVHWDLISQRWLKEPLKYGNAWLTTFYLVFLLVRYRKQPQKK
jgi:hypothetical protein